MKHGEVLYRGKVKAGYNVKSPLPHMMTVQRKIHANEWMDERCFRPLLCTVKAELGRGQPGLMR